MEERAEGKKARADGREIGFRRSGGWVFFVIFIFVVLVFRVGSSSVGAVVVVSAEIATAAFVGGPFGDLTLFVGGIVVLCFVAAERWR